jgi:hypothetical protein
MIGLWCTNSVRDSSREAGFVAGLHEQTYTADLQDQELAGLQRSAQAPWLADDPLAGRVVRNEVSRAAGSTPR